jgi:hypothetical protein
MLVLILIWVYLFITTWLLGITILYLTKTYIFRIGDRVIVSSYIGFIVLGNLLLIISLFTALSSQIGCLSLIFFLFLLIPSIRKELNNILSSINMRFFACVVVLLLAVVIYSLQYVIWYDTGLYHYSIVKWLSKFGTINGFALIYFPFGYLSSWFPLTAPLEHGALVGRVCSVINGAILFLMSLHFNISLYRVLLKKNLLTDLFMVICFPMTITLLLLQKMPVSLAPDFFVIVLIITVGWLIIKLSEDSDGYHSNDLYENRNILPVILASGALSIKLSALPAVLIAMFFYWYKEKFNVKKMLLSISIATLLFIPVMFEGFKTSGCPLYPYPFCFNLPWSIGIANIKNIYAHMSEFYRWGSWSHHSAGISCWHWIILWVNSGLINKISILLIILSVIVVFFILISRECRKMPGIKWVIMIGSFGTIFGLYKAPDYRFLWAYITIIPPLIGLFFISRKSKFLFIGRISYYVPVSLILSTCIVMTIFFKTTNEKGVYRAIDSGKLIVSKENLLLFPPKLISFQCIKSSVGGKKCYDCSRLKLISNQVNGVAYVVPEIGDQCWAAKFPCFPESLKGVQLKDPRKGIAAGFVKD